MELWIRARVWLKATRLVRGFQPVHFRGRVRGLPAGSLVEVQGATDKNRWQTFRTTKAKRRGRFHTTYTFRRTGGRAEFRFRARVRSSPENPMQTGYSPTLNVVWTPW